MTDWLGKLPIVQDYVASREHVRERNQAYAFWTTGAFEADALDKLKSEQAHRRRRLIAWKDGAAVRKLASNLRLKTIGDALDQHFMKHPLGVKPILS